MFNVEFFWSLPYYYIVILVSRTMSFLETLCPFDDAKVRRFYKSAIVFVYCVR